MYYVTLFQSGLDPLLMTSFGENKLWVFFKSYSTQNKRVTPALLHPKSMVGYFLIQFTILEFYRGK